MPVLTRLFTALAALLLLTSPGFAPIGARTVNAGTLAKPALWVVKDKDTTIYLFGTIHVLRPDVRWFHGRVKSAFDKSDTLVMEVLTPDTAAVAATTARLALDPDGPPLSQKLDAPTRARYLALLDHVGLPQAQLEPFHPWFAAVSLSIAPLERLGYSPDSGAEEVLKKAAADKHKQIIGLESIDQQLGFFAGLPEAVQLRFLVATIADAEKAETEIARMVNEWAAGRPAALAEDMNDSLKEMPEIADTLLYKRNQRWADWIRARMEKPGTVFVAVGAGHLAGKGSVQEELAARDLTVKRID